MRRKPARCSAVSRPRKYALEMKQNTAAIKKPLYFSILVSIVGMVVYKTKGLYVFALKRE